ncbi:hypothetical protein [Rhodococcus sp. B10]|uniref:hypothetical protein n=1 Tax=Rhodococcus sp. B10 TaxID=2695876 RepID=UPI00143116F9|nr:hypothetical protein [Rhodococcus sp. B10]
MTAALTLTLTWLKDRRRNSADTNQIIANMYAGSVKFADERLDKAIADLDLCSRKCDALSDLVLGLIDQSIDQATARTRHREIQSWRRAS